MAFFRATNYNRPLTVSIRTRKSRLVANGHQLNFLPGVLLEQRWTPFLGQLSGTFKVDSPCLNVMPPAEPPRLFRRPVHLSPAPMAGLS